MAVLSTDLDFCCAALLLHFDGLCRDLLPALLPPHWQFQVKISSFAERHRKNQRVDANRLSKPKPDRKIRIKHYRVGAAIAAHGLSLDDPPTWIEWEEREEGATRLALDDE